jgi:hypothetical protein
MVTVNVVVLAGTVSADPVERRMPSGDEVPERQHSRAGPCTAGRVFNRSVSILCRDVALVSHLLHRRIRPWWGRCVLSNAPESNALSLWFICCVAGGLVFIVIGARAAGLALLGAVPGAWIGLLVGSNFDLIPRNMMVGASVGAFVVGLAGLAWTSQASTSVLYVLGSATIFVGVVAWWGAYSQACDGLEKRCLPEVYAGSLALFALDVAWVVALCVIQAAQSNAARRSAASVEPGP